jgi:hypothetical protein
MLHYPQSKPLVNLRAQRRRPHFLVSAVVTVTFLLLCSSAGHSYSVLAHEAIIDSAWERVRALLLELFPNATPETLRRRMATPTAGPWSKTSATISTGVASLAI